jgi:hypothetical protein
MSGHLRFCFPAFVLFAGFSPSPAYSNAFADFFNFNSAPQQATAPAAAKEECLPLPGKSTVGLRWVYRLDGHRKCWFQAAEEIAVKKQVRYRRAKPTVAAAGETESTQRKRTAVVDARAELLHAAPAETSPPMRSAPELKVVDAAPALATGVVAFVPPAPVEKLQIDRLTPDHRTRAQVDVETSLAAKSATTDAASMFAAPIAYLTTQEVDDERSWTTTWLGVLLMALGFVSVLGSSRTVRESLAAARLTLGQNWLSLGRALDRRRKVPASSVLRVTPEGCHHCLGA